MEEKIFTNCTVGGAVKVYVEDGRIKRVRPIVLNKNDAEAWSITARGQVFTPPRKSTLGPMVYTEKQRVYENRVSYPQIRVDFSDPNGERNPQNRGKSGYRRATWEEALNIVSEKSKGYRIHMVKKESLTAMYRLPS